ncbi:MAG TPA: PEP-CTERM sorting domain-containing protein [Phycisphaerae bacterium]|nr:PEP-CTERM sorting domain-containing protein [Phycisphaerae bacterium]
MKKAVLSVLVGLFICSPAWGDLTYRDRSQAQIVTAANPIPLGEGSGLRGGTPIYDSLGPGTGGYIYEPPGLGVIGEDDWSPWPTSSPWCGVTQVTFAGGVTAADGLLWFKFYTDATASRNFATSFGVVLPTAGNFIWQITIPWVPSFWLPPVYHPYSLEVVANTTFTGGGGTFATDISARWALTTPDAVVVGSNLTTWGGGYQTGLGPLVHAFRFEVPEPTTLALLVGGAALACSRRRR